MTTKVDKKNNKFKKILLLSVALLTVVCGGVLFVGAVSGWFSGPEKATIDTEYYCHEPKCYFELDNIDEDEYEKMINDGKSFVVFVDQGGCTTADRLREYAEQYSNAKKFRFFRMWFIEAKQGGLGEYVKYYPSVAVVSRGRVIAWLRADSDEDAPVYNNYEDFEEWMGKYIIE